MRRCGREERQLRPGGSCFQRTAMGTSAASRISQEERERVGRKPHFFHVERSHEDSESDLVDACMLPI